MSCTCAQRKYPCPIHKDNPLPPTVDARISTYVIHVHELWPVGDKKGYYTTVVKDSIECYRSPNCALRIDAIVIACEMIKDYFVHSKKPDQP